MSSQHTSNWDWTFLQFKCTLPTTVVTTILRMHLGLVKHRVKFQNLKSSWVTTSSGIVRSCHNAIKRFLAMLHFYHEMLPSIHLQLPKTPQKHNAIVSWGRCQFDQRCWKPPRSLYSRFEAAVPCYMRTTHSGTSYGELWKHKASISLTVLEYFILLMTLHYGWPTHDPKAKCTHWRGIIGPHQQFEHEENLKIRKVNKTIQ